MTQPAVTITELDGALGILPASAGRLFALVGVSSSGPVDTPATYARISDIESAFGIGPLVEAAAHYIERYGRPVVLVRTGQTTAGTFTSVVFTGSGTSVVTTDAATFPDDDFEAYFLVVDGGTIGTDGITFRWSLDGGRTLSPVTALGTANSFTFPDSGGVTIDFAAGTLVAGDLATFRCNAPLWDNTELGAAMDALIASILNWEIVHVVGDAVAANFQTVDTKLAGAAVAGKYKSAYMHTRMPNIGETEAAYKTALDTIFASEASNYISLCAGASKLVSSVSGRQYRRPVSYQVSALEQSRSEEENIAAINIGRIPGTSIRDSNGNPDEHDESVNPGLDDSRFTVLRTFDGIQGIYVNRARLFSAAGSDFDLHTKRRVLNLANAALRSYFLRRLNLPILVDETTGFILEREAREIEAGAVSAMRSVLLARPKASSVEFVLSRTDNILSTLTLTGDARVTPLGYPEQIQIDVGFKNPALQVQQVG